MQQKLKRLSIYIKPEAYTYMYKQKIISVMFLLVYTCMCILIMNTCRIYHLKKRENYEDERIQKNVEKNIKIYAKNTWWR